MPKGVSTIGVRYGVTLNKLSHLIEAFQILLKYGDYEYPTNCGHDILYVKGPKEIEAGDAKRLGELGFTWNAKLESWYSVRFGSA